MLPKNSGKKKRLAVITTHPVQYNAPVFRLLTQRGKIDLKVFYTWGVEVLQNKFDPGFNRSVQWDIPLLEGYAADFLQNNAKNKGAHHFWGIQTTDGQKKIAAWKPDAVLVFGWSYASHLQLLTWAKGRYRTLFRGDSTLLDEPGQNRLKKAFRKIFLKWVYRNVDCALYAGKAGKAYFQKFGLKGRQLVFAPHAVDNRRFAENRAETKQQAGAWRQQLGIREHELVFLFAGKLEMKKNPLLLLQAFLTAGLQQAHLVYCGSGELENELKAKASGNNCIHFIGFQNQSKMPVVYRMADVFVLPSVGPGETWGLSVNEAMACSKPVLVSLKCGCVSDLVHEGINGYSFNPCSCADLAAKLQRLQAQKKELPMMGEAGRQIIEGYTLEKFAVAIEESLLQTGTSTKAVLQQQNLG